MAKRSRGHGGWWRRCPAWVLVAALLLVVTGPAWHRHEHGGELACGGAAGAVETSAGGSGRVAVCAAAAGGDHEHCSLCDVLRDASRPVTLEVGPTVVYGVVVEVSLGERVERAASGIEVRTHARGPPLA